MKIVLPIEKAPLIKSYLHYAFPMSILMTEAYYNDWILNNFIQLVFDPADGCQFDYHETIYNSWPCLRSRTLYVKDFERHYMDPVEYIKQEIQSGVYAIAWVDMYYICGHAYYQKSHKQHGLLLYGFDMEINSFYAMQYASGNKYKECIIPFVDFQKAYIGQLSEDESVYIDFVEINRNACVDYDFYRIQHKLNCYLNSKSYDVDNIKYHSNITIKKYGVDACCEIIEYLRKVQLSRIEIDLRYPYVFVEHKRCMMFRVQKILEEHYISEYPFSEKDFEQLTTDAEKVLILCIKYQCTKKEIIISEICNLMENILFREKQMLQPIIDYKRESCSVLPRKDGNPRYKPLDLL